MANVVVAWQSVVGGSATTAKLSVPPRLGVSAKAGTPIARRHAANRTVKYDEWRISVEGYVTLPDFATNIDSTMLTLRRLLDAPAGMLVYQGKGLGNVTVKKFDGLAVRFVRGEGARIMLRGLRTLSDMEYEFTMSLMNLSQDSEIETIFLMAKQEYSHFSSSLIREIATFGGNLDQYVPPEIRQALQARARVQHE